VKLKTLLNEMAVKKFTSKEDFEAWLKKAPPDKIIIVGKKPRPFFDYKKAFNVIVKKDSHKITKTSNVFSAGSGYGYWIVAAAKEWSPHFKVNFNEVFNIIKTSPSLKKYALNELPKDIRAVKYLTKHIKDTSDKLPKKEFKL
jgi:hypothetical protein